MPERLPPRGGPGAPQARPAARDEHPHDQPRPQQQQGPDAAKPQAAGNEAADAGAARRLEPLTGAGQFELFAPRRAQPQAPQIPPPQPAAAPPRTRAPESTRAAEPALREARSPTGAPESAMRAPEPSARVPEPRGPRVYTVGELTREVKAILEGRFPDLLVEGEISNLRAPSSGHLYFTLKDEDACIDAVLFKTQARLLRFSPQNGHRILARGRLTLYEPQGRYQIICDSVEPLGAGALQVAFEQLKARLSKEGLFDKSRKRPLPYLPRRIAVVTSPSGAAVHDFLRVLHRRFPNLPVLIVPARVQGDGAAAEIARAIARAARAPRVDVVVVARGGGSIEDLWPFNEEIVARALAACPVPTVSAVGHEVDFTIADFAADARAATPTAAAEMLARVKEELVADLSVRRARLVRAMRAQLAERQHALGQRRARIADPRRLIGERRLRLDRLEQRLTDGATDALSARLAVLRALRGRLDRAHPSAQLHRLRGEVSRLQDRLAALATRALAQRRQRFEGLAGTLDALSPLRVLARGYAVAFDESGHALRSAAEAHAGQRLRLRLAEGQLDAQVIGQAAPSAPARAPEGAAEGRGPPPSRTPPK